MTIKDYLTKFAKNIFNISESFNILSNDLNKKLDSIKPQDNKDALKKISKFTFNEKEFNNIKENKKKKESLNLHKKLMKQKIYSLF